MNEPWKTMVSAAKAAHASTNGNDTPIEADDAADVSTGTPVPKAECIRPAEQQIPHYHYSRC